MYILEHANLNAELWVVTVLFLVFRLALQFFSSTQFASITTTVRRRGFRIKRARIAIIHIYNAKGGKKKRVSPSSLDSVVACALPTSGCAEPSLPPPPPAPSETSSGIVSHTIVSRTYLIISDNKTILDLPTQRRSIKGRLFSDTDKSALKKNLPYP
ncbi:hypothetical protein QE152_g9473 [Popillia japonica]|uniref:ATP synthase F0 subunit 8 n=1 Tax=Popillia japonica TaxID=7064 RepID=A0AAW1LUL5_POPJA